MYSALALALLSQVSAFGLIVISSGSTVHLSGINIAEDGHLTISEGTQFDGEIGSDGELTVDGKAVGVDSDGFLVVGGENPPKFGQDDTHLTIDGVDGFNVCPSEDGKVGTSAAKCGDVVNVALRIIGGTDASPNPAATPAAANGDASTVVAEETVVETVCTHESCAGVAPANSAIRNSVLGGVAAVAAALL